MSSATHERMAPKEDGRSVGYGSREGMEVGGSDQASRGVRADHPSFQGMEDGISFGCLLLRQKMLVN